VDDSVISWTESSLPVTYDHFNHLPVIMIPTFPPGAFGKITPANGSQEPHADQYLFDWSDSDGATGYDFCYDQTLDGECTGSWFPLSGSRSYINLGFFFPGYIYEWQIRATNSTGEATYADNGTVWSFTIANPP
jgi:hypothetical protein